MELNNKKYQQAREDLNRIWDEAFRDDIQLESKELKMAKKRAKRLYAELKRRGNIQMTPALSHNTRRFFKFGYAAAAAILLGLLILAIRKMKRKMKN